MRLRPMLRWCLDGRVMAAAGYRDGARWRECDRLERFVRLGVTSCGTRAGPAIMRSSRTMGTMLTYAGLDAHANQLTR